jgi:hypothetical protein
MRNEHTAKSIRTVINNFIFDGATKDPDAAACP